MMRDNDLGVVRVRAFGTYDFRIVDTRRFLKEVAGSDHNFRLDEFAETMRSRIVSVFGDALASAQVPVFDVASRYTELGEALLPLINPVVAAVASRSPASSSRTSRSRRRSSRRSTSAPAWPPSAT